MRNLPHGFGIYLLNVKTMRKIFFKLCVLLKKSEIYKRRGVGSQKKFWLFVNHYKVLAEGVGGQTPPKLVNVVSERPLTSFLMNKTCT